MIKPFEFTTPRILRAVCALSILIPAIVFPLTGNLNKEASDKFSLWVTPPGIFFRIWLVIVTLLDISALYSLYYNFWSPKSCVCFISSNICIGIWIFVFVQATPAALIFSTLIIFGLVASNQIQWFEECRNEKEGWKELFIRNSFAFGQGWFIAAASLSYGIVLVYVFGMKL